MRDRIAKATAGVVEAYQEAQRSFDEKREEELKGLPWLMGIVAIVISDLQEEYSKARFKRIFWEEYATGESGWVLEITYPESEMGSIRADNLENGYCFEVMEEHGLTVNLVSSGRRE